MRQDRTDSHPGSEPLPALAPGSVLFVVRAAGVVCLVPSLLRRTRKTKATLIRLVSNQATAHPGIPANFDLAVVTGPAPLDRLASDRPATAGQTETRRFVWTASVRAGFQDSRTADLCPHLRSAVPASCHRASVREFARLALSRHSVLYHRSLRHQAGLFAADPSAADCQCRLETDCSVKVDRLRCRFDSHLKSAHQSPVRRALMRPHPEYLSETRQTAATSDRSRHYALVEVERDRPEPVRSQQRERRRRVLPAHVGVFRVRYPVPNRRRVRFRAANGRGHRGLVALPRRPDPLIRDRRDSVIRQVHLPVGRNELFAQFRRVHEPAAVRLFQLSRQPHACHPAHPQAASSDR